TFFYKESRVHRKQKIDWFGAITLVGAVVSLMFALELGGQKYDWDSNFILSLFGGFAILIIAFIFIERKVEEPIISFEMFKQRLFGMSTIIALCYGAAFMSATVYIPLFIQGVYGGSATNSGLLLLPMMLGSVVTAQLGGFLTTKLSYRNIMIISAVIMLIGLFLLSTLTPETSRILLTVYMIIIGFGVGFSFSVLSMAAIHNFGMEQRGSATSTSNFIRSLGMTLGITIFGMIQRTGFQDQLEEAFKGMSGGMNTNALGDSRAILSESARSQIPPQILDKIIDALSSSIVQTFMWALVPAGLAFIFIFFMGNERMVIKKKQTNKKSETSKA
ncbi:MFS transporter, partial [Bacillus wiedmannii]